MTNDPWSPLWSKATTLHQYEDMMMKIAPPVKELRKKKPVLSVMEKLKKDKYYRQQVLARFEDTFHKKSLMSLHLYADTASERNRFPTDKGAFAREIMEKWPDSPMTPLLKSLAADKWKFRLMDANPIMANFGGIARKAPQRIGWNDVLRDTQWVKAPKQKKSSGSILTTRFTDRQEYGPWIYAINQSEELIRKCLYENTEPSEWHVNKIIKIFHSHGLLKKKEEITEMKDHCYLSGYRFNKETKRSILLFKNWPSGPRERRCNIHMDTMIDLIPIYKVPKAKEDQLRPSVDEIINTNDGSINLETESYTKMNLLGELGQAGFGMGDFGMELFKINTGVSERWIILSGSYSLGDFVEENFTRRENLRYLQIGTIAPLGYHTQPLYRHEEIVETKGARTYGLEIEVKSPYNSTIAIVKNGKRLTPNEVFRIYNWVISFDRSIAPGFELKSPILNEKNPWEYQIPDSIKNLIDTTAKDAHCGGHVHLGTYYPKLTFLQFQYWTWLFAILYPKRAQNEYCQIRLINFGYGHEYKRQWLRLRERTVEFRIFPAFRNCRDIYWRMKLLKLLDICNTKHDPKSVSDTVGIWLSEDSNSDALRKHIFSSRSRNHLIKVFDDKFWRQGVSQTTHYMDADEEKYRHVIFPLQEQSKVLDSIAMGTSSVTEDAE